MEKIYFPINPTRKEQGKTCRVSLRAYKEVKLSLRAIVRLKIAKIWKMNCKLIMGCFITRNPMEVLDQITACNSKIKRNLVKVHTRILTYKAHIVTKRHRAA
jgi:hypothetical protein